MRKIIAFLLAIITVVSLTVPALASAPALKKVEYEGSGIVEVDFSKRVSYKSCKVTVKGADGKSYTAGISEKDNDELTFKVKNIKAGQKYTFAISGVRAGTSGSYGKVTGTFSVPGKKTLSIKSTDLDRSDRELDIEFSGKVQYKNLKVTLKSISSGKTVTLKVLEKDRDSLELRVPKLTKGAKFTVKVSGVRLSGSGSYTSVSKSFTAR